ncbi:MAG: hypothetical protein LQ338_007112 [Usnochroma carphineum]|nr:MAG: hypothetical protein LQ338_007112 [Usnochroma carphineum]
MSQDSKRETPSNPSKMKESHAGDYDTPSPKRQRTTRASTSGKSMNYDMKYHPMDDVLRPAASAARRKAHGLDTSPESTTSGSSQFVEDPEETESESPSSSSRTILEAPITLETPPRRPVPPRSGSPSGRRVTRAELNGEKPVMYDMKHHPADVVLRPAAAKRIYEKWSAVPNASPHTFSSTKSQVPVGAAKLKHEHPNSPSKYHVNETSPVADRAPLLGFEPSDTHNTDPAAYRGVAASATENLYPPSDHPPVAGNQTSNALAATPIAERTDAALSANAPASTTDRTMGGKVVANGYRDTLGANRSDGAMLAWRAWPESERLVYLLQKGAPHHSITLPLAWLELAHTLPRIKSCGGTTDEIEVIRTRYAEACLKLQAQFNAKPDPAKVEDWTLHYAEGFDVYDYEVGEKYFRSRSDSVVQPVTHHLYELIAARQQEINWEWRSAAGLNPDGNMDATSIAIESPGRRRWATSDRDQDELRPKHPVNEDYLGSDADMGQDDQKVLGGDDERHQPVAGIEDTDDGDDDDGSYNDAEGYIRQAMGQCDENSSTRDDSLSTQRSPEKELLASMSISANIDEVFELHELTSMFRSSAEPNIQTSDEQVEPRQLLRPRRNKRYTKEPIFTVHEDQPGGTPKIKRQIAMNPKSPGTDIPKENLQERSASEETDS